MEEQFAAAHTAVDKTTFYAVVEQVRALTAEQAMDYAMEIADE